MTFQLDDSIISWLADHDILFTWAGLSRFRASDAMVVSTSAIIEPFTLFESGRRLCTMGAFSYIRSEPTLDMVIGRYCSIGPGMKVLGTSHPTERFTTSPLTYDRKYFRNRIQITQNVETLTGPGPITIGHDVWIGQDVTIAQGVTIETGAVVAAGALVTRNIPSYEIWGGVPAKLIRRRFPEATCESLLASEWWQYHADTLRQIPMNLEVSIFLDELKRIDEQKKIIAPYEHRGFSEMLAEAINSGSM